MDGTEYDEVLENQLRNPIVFKHVTHFVCIYWLYASWCFTLLEQENNNTTTHTFSPSLSIGSKDPFFTSILLLNFLKEFYKIISFINQ